MYPKKSLKVSRSEPGEFQSDIHIQFVRNFQFRRVYGHDKCVSRHYKVKGFGTVGAAILAASKVFPGEAGCDGFVKTRTLYESGYRGGMICVEGYRGLA